MHPFTGQSTSRPFSNSRPLSFNTSASTANIGFLIPLYPQTRRTRFFSGSLIKRKLPARSCHRILAFANSRKSLNRNAPNRITYIPRPSVAPETKCRLAIGMARKQRRVRKGGRSLLKRGINYARIPIGINAPF